MKSILKTIRGNFKIILLSIYLIYSLGPSSIREFVYNKGNMSSLNDVELNEVLGDVRTIAIDMVNSSDNILNKDELINRINNVSYKYYKDIHYLREMGDMTIMAYTYDKNTDIDYIIVYYPSVVS